MRMAVKRCLRFIADVVLVRWNWRDYWKNKAIVVRPVLPYIKLKNIISVKAEIQNRKKGFLAHYTKEVVW